jgi:hypothetical protein
LLSLFQWMAINVIRPALPRWARCVGVSLILIPKTLAGSDTTSVAVMAALSDITLIAGVTAVVTIFVVLMVGVVVHVAIIG